jgi:hypothetical protein
MKLKLPSSSEKRNADRRDVVKLYSIQLKFTRRNADRLDPKPNNPMGHHHGLSGTPAWKEVHSDRIIRQNHHFTASVIYVCLQRITAGE